jgi:EAL and modified HD-GYP domain-containing signal transduction protein
MAAKGGRLDRGTAFLVGLFSLLDAVFRIPLPDVLERVNLAPEVMSALVDRQGPFAQMLQVVESYELELWEFAAESAEPLNVPAVALPELFASALHLAHEHIPSAARKVA